jgi:integrase
MCCPADPPTVEELILVMREAGPGPYADRIRGLIAILWRAGLRISEALALTERICTRTPGRCWSEPSG